jgi:hypothetical protein
MNIKNSNKNNRCGCLSSRKYGAAGVLKQHQFNTEPKYENTYKLDSTNLQKRLGYISMNTYKFK